MEKNIHTFIGCESDYANARIVLFGAPFDSTTSFRPGTRFAARAMRDDSIGLETYSPYQDRDLADFAVFDGGDLELPFGGPERALAEIERYTSRVLDDGKLPCMLGGEHLVTLGAVRACARRHPDLHIVHFDAHADLRAEYGGEALSHASVIRRCHDILGDGRIYQFGIRSGERGEFEWAKEHVHMTRFGFDGLTEAVRALAGAPVYFTLDLDVLDPSVFPGTGTPEGGGVGFEELRKACMRVAALNLVGLDINELCPMLDTSGASTAIACKLVRELLLALAK